jgi:AsmA protein
MQFKERIIHFSKRIIQLDKRTLKIAGIAVTAVVAILIALPLFININSFKPKIESELTNAMGRQVTLGKLSLSILRGSVPVDDVSIADDPAFSNSPFITAKSLKVGIELMPLIFSKQLNVTGIVLDEPQITLLKSGNGRWNFSSLGGAGQRKSPEPAKSEGPQALSIAKLDIKDGKLVVGKANSTAKPQVYDKLNIELRDFSSATQFPFKLTTNLPGGAAPAYRAKRGPSIRRTPLRLPLTRP